ncbi:magnesium transporter [Candidatus Korarchaeum cryptofilum]|uniref:MgtE integral membrane region n=1 Tax=Korarchaeum cryptofilum (strain OPF8) TaxID=374847 RepID=B1L598_KORCO|nr:magnesium transporter [Candidatus Korarchaeum cryptofilum]ACB07627.1 MgtE integral membrane region [Candidatus Korarchaeum cryptofilum OPF8]
MLKDRERKFQILRDSMFSLSFDMGGLIAGGLLESFSGLALRTGWSIALYPIVLTGRGALNGIEAARISTGLHLGTVKPTFRGNTKYYYSILASMVTLSLLMSLLMGSLAFIFSGATLEELPIILSTAISSQTIAIILIVPATSLAGHESFKRGLDPDAVVYPISSTVADIWATISYIIALTIAFGPSIINHIIASATVIFTLLVIVIFSREEEFRRTIRESFPTVASVTLISSISGFSLSSARKRIEETPGILTIYPAIIDTLGDCGAIFGSTSTTKLFTGLMEPSLSEISSRINELAQIWIAGLIYYFLYAIIGFSVGGSLRSFAIPLLVYSILFPLISLFTFSLAIVAFRKGLNPDNFIIPLETTMTDTITTVMLSAILSV